MRMGDITGFDDAEVIDLEEDPEEKEEEDDQ